MSSDVLRVITAKIARRKSDFVPVPGLVCSFVNPASLESLGRSTISTITLWGVDGISLALLIERTLRFQVPRFSFDMTSVAPIVLGHCERNGLAVFVIGTTPPALASALHVLKGRYPKLLISGSSHGYLSASDRESAIANIIEGDTDVVICGMGTPTQEVFLGDLVKAGYKGAAYTCGGFLHQLGVGVSYYPGFVDRFNLRALYRFIREPHTRRRYLIAYPRSLYRSWGKLRLIAQERARGE